MRPKETTMAATRVLKQTLSGRYYYGFGQFRWFPIKAAQAELMLSTGEAIYAEKSFLTLTARGGRS
jgi:hypothetical protein